jgi:Calcineurin-like phosphoesterase
MKIGLVTDIHLGDYRRDKEFDIRKLELLKSEFDSSCPEIILNLADTVSHNKYLRPEETREDYWKQYLEFKSSLNCSVIEVCIDREKDFFAKMFDLPGNYYKTDFNDCTFFCLAPEFDKDHTLSEKQLNWLKNEFKNVKTRWQFVLAHVPVEQATERLPGKEIYLTDSEILKDIACKYGNFTFFIGGHFHAMPLPKTEPGLTMVMAGIVDSLNPDNNDLNVRYIELKEQSVNLKTITIDMLSVKSVSREFECFSGV